MLERKEIENYKGYIIIQYDGENGYRIDFGSKRSKLFDTVDNARQLIDLIEK